MELLLESESNNPGKQSSMVLQYPWAGSVWYLPDGQSLHVAELLSLEYLPIEHVAHAFAVALM
jgi:hypothetical protein